MNTYEQHSTRKLAVTLVSVMVIAGSVLLADHIKLQATTDAQHSHITSTPATVVAVNPTTAATTAPATANTPALSSGYTDGTYKATSDYYVPSGNETVQVTVTLKNGSISDASIRNSESNSVSSRYQEDFASVYKSYVVGKKISSLQIGAIAGASYTSQGFSDAISQIAAKAKA
jgi:uncharacterized protein with FMN-binding domain